MSGGGLGEIMPSAPERPSRSDYALCGTGESGTHGGDLNHRLFELHEWANITNPGVFMRMIIAAACLFPLVVLTACGDRAPVQGEEPDRTGQRGTDVVQSVSDHPLFAKLRDDDALTADFKTYMKWVASLRVPDAILVVKMMEADKPTVDSVASVFHEKVEFKEWMNLGHKINDIMTVPYYQAKYPEVYPVAHRAGIIAEFSLIKHFAKQNGYRDLPVLAYASVSPLVEHHATTPRRLARRLQYNPEYVSASVSDEDLELAVQVYEAGGYQYKDRAKILQGARVYLAERAVVK